MLENFTYGKMKEFNLSYDQVKQQKPDIIYTTVNSYGNDGEMKNKPALDLIIQAYTGIMHITGGPDIEPFKVGFLLCDIITGAHVYSSIIAALLHKERIGEGQYINSSLVECNIFAMPTIVSAYLNAGVNAKRKGNDHPNCSPYTLFKVADGYLSIGVTTDYHLKSFVKY